MDITRRGPGAGKDNQPGPRPSWLDAHPAATLVARRVLAGFVTLLVASFFIFCAIQFLPGDVANAVLGRNATPAAVEALRGDLHLNDPFLLRYLSWLGGAVTGHFGNSSAALAQGSRIPVWTIIKVPLQNSLVLAGITMAVLLVLAPVLGTLGAIRAGRLVDHLISIPALVIGSMPEFLIGILLILLFFDVLGILPPIASIAPGENPFTHPTRLVLPCLTLLGASLAASIRMIRATTIDQLHQDYVTMARLNGYSERRVVWRYALRNAMPASIQTLALTMRYLVGGIIVTETLFAYPGVGALLVQAVSVRDVQEVSIIATLLAAIYVALNILADLAVFLLIPKLRAGT